jgi:hypothetical protein
MRKFAALPRGTLALIVEGKVGQDYVEWAVDALMDDFDSPSLGILAGLDLGDPVSQYPVSREEAHGYFRKVIHELALLSPEDEQALSLPDPEVVLRWHLCELAEQIRDGVLDPVTGIDRIHAEVVSPLDHAEDVKPWCYLGDTAMSDRRTGRYAKEYARAIIDYATQWVKNAEAETRG